MNKYLKILLHLLLYNVVFPYIVIPFKGNNLSTIYNTFHQKNFLEDFIMSTYYNQLYTAIGIGNPNQHIVLAITPNQVDFLFNKMNCLFFYNNNYIDKSNLFPNNRTIQINKTKIGYNKTLSKSFIKNSNTNLPLFYKNNNYLTGKENLQIDDYRNILTKNYDTHIFPYCQNHLVNFGFVYEDINNEKQKQNTEICGSIGLALYYEKNNNKFIEQLKSSNITTNYYWSFNYTSLDAGYIIFGILPHEYNPNQYNIENLVETYTNIEEGDSKWSIDLNEIYFFSTKNKKISVPSTIAEGEFEFNLQLIIGSYSYKELIIKYYFKDFYDKNICIEEDYKLDIKYSIIRCKKEKLEKYLQLFPTLFLYNRGLKNIFELSYEDLLISVGDYTYFLILFRKEGLYQSNQTWKLGIPFLKKHQIIFNTDTKRVGYYVKDKISINNDNNSKKDNLNKKGNNKDSVDFLSKIKNIISLRSFLEIIIIIIFTILLICFGKKLYNYKNKQKKPYELQDEDYDYFSNNSLENRKKKDNGDINKIKNNNGIKGQIIEMKSQ